MIIGLGKDKEYVDIVTLWRGAFLGLNACGPFMHHSSPNPPQACNLKVKVTGEGLT